MRSRFAHLPETAVVRDREVDVEYDVEDPDGTPFGIARLRIPEKLARTIAESELPVLDRPLRFVVIRGQRGAVRANTLDELQELLERPWSPDEVDEPGELSGHGSRQERQARDLAGRQRNGRSAHGRSGQGSGKPGRGGGSRRKFRGR